MPALEGGAAAWVNELRVADMDGDGRRDIVTGNLVGGSNPRLGVGVAVLRNRGQRRFALTTPTTVRSGEDLVVADLNGDGRRDLFVNGRVYLRGSGGRFVAGRQHGDHVVNFSELADVDTDGRADLLYSLNQRRVVRHGARRGFGPRRFYERTVPEAPEGIGAILKTATGDLDGDGRDDQQGIVLTPCASAGLVPVGASLRVGLWDGVGTTPREEAIREWRPIVAACLPAAAPLRSVRCRPGRRWRA